MFMEGNNPIKVFTEVAEELKTQLDAGGLELIKVKKSTNTWFIQNWSVLFMYNLKEIIINNNLTTVDILVLLQLVEYMELGNIVQVTHSLIASVLKKSRPNISRSIKKLKQCGVILNIDNNMYLNPHIVVKGKLNPLEHGALLVKGEDELKKQGLKKSIRVINLDDKQN